MLGSVEKSFYLIKPEAFESRDEIRATIEASGLVIVDCARFKLTSRQVDELYPDVDIGVRMASHHFLAGKVVEAGVISGPDAIRRLVDLGGSAVDPASCAKESIRRRFGCGQPMEYAGTKYYLNAFHRARDRKEADAQIRLFTAWRRVP